MSNSIHEEALEEFVNRAEKELEDSLKRLILYGSMARGEYQEDSDIDIFAVVEKKEDLEVLRDVAFEVGVMDYGVSISVQGETDEEFQDFSRTSYLRNVERDGIEYAGS